MDKSEAHSENEIRLLRLEQEVADLRKRLARLENPSESEIVLEPATEPMVQPVPQSIDQVATTEERPPDGRRIAHLGWRWPVLRPLV